MVQYICVFVFVGLSTYKVNRIWQVVQSVAQLSEHYFPLASFITARTMTKVEGHYFIVNVASGDFSHCLYAPVVLFLGFG